MVQYDILTKKYPFGDNKLDLFLDEIKIEKKRIETVGTDKLRYVVERKKVLTDKEIAKIKAADGVYEIGESK